MFKNYFEKNKLVKYYERLMNHTRVNLPENYLEYHKTEIDCLLWLIAYYENRTASSPKEYLESLINFNFDSYRDYANEMRDHDIVPLSEIERLKLISRQTKFLYHWVNYKKITGF